MIARFQFYLWIALFVSLSTSAHADDSKTVTLLIEGMVTDNCPVLVETALSKVEGVRSSDASLKTKRVVVVYDPDQIKPPEIVKIIKDRVGFDSRIVKRSARVRK